MYKIHLHDHINLGVYVYSIVSVEFKCNWLSLTSIKNMINIEYIKVAIHTPIV